MDYVYLSQLPELDVPRSYGPVFEIYPMMLIAIFTPQYFISEWIGEKAGI